MISIFLALDISDLYTHILSFEMSETHQLILNQNNEMTEIQSGSIEKLVAQNVTEQQGAEENQQEEIEEQGADENLNDGGVLDALDLHYAHEPTLETENPSIEEQVQQKVPETEIVTNAKAETAAVDAGAFDSVAQDSVQSHAPKPEPGIDEVSGGQEDGNVVPLNDFIEIPHNDYDGDEIVVEEDPTVKEEEESRESPQVLDPSTQTRMRNVTDESPIVKKQDNHDDHNNMQVDGAIPNKDINKEAELEYEDEEERVEDPVEDIIDEQAEDEQTNYQVEDQIFEVQDNNNDFFQTDQSEVKDFENQTEQEHKENHDDIATEQVETSLDPEPTKPETKGSITNSDTNIIYSSATHCTESYEPDLNIANENIGEIAASKEVGNNALATASILKDNNDSSPDQTHALDSNIKNDIPTRDNISNKNGTRNENESENENESGNENTKESSIEPNGALDETEITDNNESETVAEHLRNDEDETLQTDYKDSHVPLYIAHEKKKILIFPHTQQDAELKTASLFADNSVANMTIEELFGALRNCEEFEFNEEEELVLTISQMGGISITEDNVYCKDVTLESFLDLYYQLSKFTDLEENIPRHLDFSLTSQPRFITKFNRLVDNAQDQNGFDKIHLMFTSSSEEPSLKKRKLTLE